MRICLQADKVRIVNAVPGEASHTKRWRADRLVNRKMAVWHQHGVSIKLTVFSDAQIDRINQEMAVMRGYDYAERTLISQKYQTVHVPIAAVHKLFQRQTTQSKPKPGVESFG